MQTLSNVLNESGISVDSNTISIISTLDKKVSRRYSNYLRTKHPVERVIDSHGWRHVCDVFKTYLMLIKGANMTDDTTVVCGALASALHDISFLYGAGRKNHHTESARLSDSIIDKTFGKNVISQDIKDTVARMILNHRSSIDVSHAPSIDLIFNDADTFSCHTMKRIIERFIDGNLSSGVPRYLSDKEEVFHDIRTIFEKKYLGYGIPKSDVGLRMYKSGELGDYNKLNKLFYADKGMYFRGLFDEAWSESVAPYLS